METFRKALKLLSNYGEDVTLGGGEPTLHPLFWEMLGLTLGTFDSEMILVVTNGSNEDIAVALANMAKKGVLSAELSQDQYHDPKLVTGRTIQAFQKHRSDHGGGNDMRNIRNVEAYGNPVIALGRGAKIEGADKQGCACDTLDVDVDGRIWLCGHRKYQVGSVDLGIELPDNHWDMDVRCSEYAFRKGMLPSRTKRLA